APARVAAAPQTRRRAPRRNSPRGAGARPQPRARRPAGRAPDPSRSGAGAAHDARGRAARRRSRSPCRGLDGGPQADLVPVFAVSPTPLVCLDPGHGTIPAVGRQTEPIGPGSSVSKIKDGGGAPGGAPVALAIALRTRALLQRDGYRVAMTRTGPTYAGGNIARAQFCN